MIIVLAFSLLNAVDYHLATGENVRPSVRDTLVYYHTNTDDQHWFGSDSWAVKFEFNEFYAGIDSLVFEAEGANIFIPGSSGTDPLTVRLCRDSFGQPLTDPDSLLFTQTIQSSEIQYQAWNYFQFPNTIIDTTKSILWLVVDYPTNSTDQFISASANGGLQSYFSNNGYYYSMFSISYDSEFLFSLQGRFLTDGTDLDLVSIEWEGDFFPSGNLYPEFTIKNNSNIPVSGSYIVPSLQTPNGNIDLIYTDDNTVCQQIMLPLLPANGTQIFNVSDSLMFMLSGIPSQYEFEAELICETDSLTNNNSIEDEFQTYIEYLDNLFIENAVQLDEVNSNNIWSTQSSVLDPSDCVIINYFADLNDEPFFNDDSYLRFHYYDLMGFPATIIGGGDKILGFFTGYFAQLTELYNSSFSTPKTFISNDSFNGSDNDMGDAVFSYQLRNAETLLFDSFINELTLRIGVLENVENELGLPTDINIPVFTYLIEEVDANQFLESTTISDSIYFNMNDDFETITGNTNNCEVVFWLQNEETQEIFYVNTLPFTEFQPGLVSLDEDKIPNANHSLHIFPNPCRTSEQMNISFSLPNTIQSAELKIYNIKGQLVKTIIQEPTSQNASFIWNGKDKVNKQVSSGIYLMQIKADANGVEYKYHKKSLLIR